MVQNKLISTMTFIPWRLKNFVSDRFPLLYHVVVNIGTSANSQAHWDAQLARSWDAPGRQWPAKGDLILSLTKPSDVILDLGCGNGGILRHLFSQGYRHLHGLEISNYAIDRLRGEGIAMHFGKLPSIPLSDATFDVIIASQVLEHIIRRHLFLREIRRSLKPQGSAFIFVPDNCLGPIDEHEHVRKYDARSLRKLLETYFVVAALETVREPHFEMPILFAHVVKEGN